ncbi:MAG: DnaJ domain-containing protein [Thermoanaerobaculia bacterium]|nr:DnaJ domain-containing protein [Thermoanaerobaculia bacterium]
MRNFYSILSLPRSASPAEVKARFRDLARERHPDRFQGEDKQRAEEEFQAIAEAFNTLSDPVRRRQHDLELDRPTQTQYDPQQVEKVYLSRGARAYKQGNFLEAADNFDRATQAAPGNAQAWHHLALAASREKRWWPKAQEAIERACQLAPDNLAYQKLAGKIFAQSGMTVRAKQYYNHALRLGGPDPAIRKALAALDPTAGGEPGTTEAAAARPARTNEAPGQEKSSLFRKLW